MNRQAEYDSNLSGYVKYWMIRTYASAIYRRSKQILTDAIMRMGDPVYGRLKVAYLDNTDVPEILTSASIDGSNIYDPSDWGTVQPVTSGLSFLERW